MKWTRYYGYKETKKRWEDDEVTKYISENGDIIQVDRYRGTVSYAVDGEDTTQYAWLGSGVVGGREDRDTKWFRTLKEAKEYVEAQR